MAVPVAFHKFAPADSRLDLMREIEDAPREHSEAVLEAYDLLQRLHDTGALALLNGLLSAGDTVVEKISDAVSSKEAVGALRIGLILGGVLTSVDADKVRAAVADVEGKPPSIFSLLRRLMSKDVLKVMALGVTLAEILGSALRSRATETSR